MNNCGKRNSLGNFVLYAMTFEHSIMIQDIPTAYRSMVTLARSRICSAERPHLRRMPLFCDWISEYISAPAHKFQSIKHDEINDEIIDIVLKRSIAPWMI